MIGLYGCCVLCNVGLVGLWKCFDVYVVVYVV